MIGKSLRVLMSLLLSALFLTGGSGMPSFFHCHVGGDHAHHHLCQDDHSHPVDDDHSANLREAGVAHVHFLWFGFGCSLPLDAESDHEDPPVPFLALGCSQQITAVGWSPTEPVLHLPAEAEIVSFAVIVERPARKDSSQVLAPPLCAKARHERSGVQLI